MAILASFIGIDRYQDGNIRELLGATRDAKALWALFSDSIPELQATCLVNEQATKTAIRAALDGTLGAAGPEDTVILSFAGHGSRSHRLLTYDSSPSDLGRTSVSMAELADAFRESQARFILCILDCCFSGGASARVFEDDNPIPRDAEVPLQVLVEGKGRILIAASSTNEAAYEQPTLRHGLFTRALLDVLQSFPDQVDLQIAMSQVMDRVRAEAARLHHTQTPMLYQGMVEGGMALPPLRAGERFHKEFPEVRGTRVDGGFSELAAFGLPKVILEAWNDRYPSGLNKLQCDAINEHRILDGKDLLVVAPTSAGKTFVGELSAVRAVTDGRKAVFLLPYRALVNEKYDQFSGLYGERLGMRVIRCTGDYQDQTSQFTRGRYDLALLTYEMFLNLVVGNAAILNQIGLVVLDEAQFITDPNRGISVELLLTLLVSARERGLHPQLIALSAVIGDVNHFDAWLGCATLMTRDRPVRLTEGALDRTGTYQYLDAEGKVQHLQLLPPHSIVTRRDKPSAQDIIVPLLQKLVANGEKVIVFRNQRGSAQGCAKYLARDLGLLPADDVIALLPTHDLSATSADLRTALRGGVAFHTANLSREERVVVEQAFRDPDSPVRAMSATTTVAAGINTPASTVVLAEQEFLGEDGRAFTVAEYKNMAGRAGRLGFNEEGKAIILADTSASRALLFQRYVMGALEPIRSSFDPNGVETWVLRLLSQVERVPRDQVAVMLANTYGGYLANRAHPNWRVSMHGQVERLIQRMLDLELLELDGEAVRLSLLGQACGRSHLSFETAMSLVDLLRSLPEHLLTPERLMALLQTLPQNEVGYTPVMKRGRAEAARVDQAVQRYGTEIVRLFQRRAQNEYDYYGRCKRAAVLWDWINGVPMETIEQRYTTNPFQGVIGPGSVRGFADATRFHLRAAHQIAAVMFVGRGLDDAAIETLLRQLEVGIPAPAVGLLSLPLTLTRGEYLALYRAGQVTSEAVWALPHDRMVELLGSTRAKALEMLRPTATEQP